jgi:hypothetical protein
MKHAIGLAFALATLVPVTSPAPAQDIEDLVRANCTKHIVSSTDVSRNQIKSFQLERNGGGFVMRGYNEEHQAVTCQAAGDGHVTWVKVG